MKKRLIRRLRKLLEPFGIYFTITASKDTKAVTLTPKSASKGNVLLSYIIDPFLLKPGESASNRHTHHWESLQIAQTFLDSGYTVDVISYRNILFTPKKTYCFFIAARTNFERIARLLNDDCKKIVHLDTSHWITSNQAGYSRLLDLQKRKNITLSAKRMIEYNRAIEVADFATVLGNEFTINSYRYAGKPIHRIRISAPDTYPWLENKDFDACRRHYVWLGSAGFVHKGLDLVLEAFADMPDHNLTVCGPTDIEIDFCEAYHKELYETQNIKTIGWIDVESQEFIAILQGAIGTVFPSCAEGGGGSAITCIHGGLIPILSEQASVDVADFGVVLRDNTVEEIKEAVRKVSRLPTDQLKTRAHDAWTYMRDNHTREIFAKDYRRYVDEVLLPPHVAKREG